MSPHWLQRFNLPVMSQLLSLGLDHLEKGWREVGRVVYTPGFGHLVSILCYKHTNVYHVQMQL